MVEGTIQLLHRTHHIITNRRIVTLSVKHTAEEGEECWNGVYMLYTAPCSLGDAHVFALREQGEEVRNKSKNYKLQYLCGSSSSKNNNSMDDDYGLCLSLAWDESSSS